jgi:hypothetical protein
VWHSSGDFDPFFFRAILVGRIFDIITLKKKDILFVVVLLENCSSIFGCGIGGDNFKK